MEKRPNNKRVQPSSNTSTVLSNGNPQPKRSPLGISYQISAQFHHPTDLFAYFRKLPHDADFEKLFRDVIVVLALFRSLDDFEKIIVARLLNLPEPSRWEPFLVWLRGNRKEAIRALNSLRSLHILSIRCQKNISGSITRSQGQNSSTDIGRQSDDGASGWGIGSHAPGSTVSTSSKTRSGVADNRYELHPVFRQTLQLNIATGFTSSPAILSSKTAKHFPTKITLQSHAAKQWNNILQWLCEGATMSGESMEQQERRFKLPYGGDTMHSHPPASGDLVTVLQRLRLVRAQLHREGSTNSSDALQNETAFQWLLLDIRSQLLSICIEFLHCLHFGLIGLHPVENSTSTDPVSPLVYTTVPVSMEVTNKQRTDVLCLLFVLAEAQIGQPCLMTELNAIQVRFLTLAYDIGLVWMHKLKGAKHFFPTPFAKLLQADGAEMSHLTSAMSTLTAMGPAFSAHGTLALSSDLPSNLYHSAYSRFFSSESLADYPLELKNQNETVLAVQDETLAEAGVIVESNFKVFAYTVSSLLLTVVARLCEIRVITPSLIVGSLSRDSVLEVYKSGVTADQIIRFFSVHAHPSIYAKARREGRSVIPENVSAQLKIWEAERRRVQMRRACVFEFSKESDLDVFPLAVSKASTGWLLMHTELPLSSNPASREEWKAKIVERLRGRPNTVELQRAIAPVLAVQAQHKDEMTAFIRNSMRDLKK